jgi:hypothetical protein
LQPKRAARGAGCIIVGLFVVTWIVALAIWQFGEIERKRELRAAQTRAHVMEWTEAAIDECCKTRRCAEGCRPSIQSRRSR